MPEKIKKHEFKKHEYDIDGRKYVHNKRILKMGVQLKIEGKISQGEEFGRSIAKQLKDKGLEVQDKSLDFGWNIDKSEGVGVISIYSINPGKDETYLETFNELGHIIIGGRGEDLKNVSIHTHEKKLLETLEKAGFVFE